MKEAAAVLRNIRREIKVKPKHRNDLAALIKLATPVFDKHDVVLKFTDYDFVDGRIQTTATLIGLEEDIKSTSFAEVDDTHVDIAYKARLNALKSLLMIADYPLVETIKAEEMTNERIGQREIFDLVSKLKAKGLHENVILERFNVSGLQQLTFEQYQRALKGLEATCTQKGR